jgi:hypothetical protein
MTTPNLTTAFDALSDGGTALASLETTCCVPDRSPSMQRLADTLQAARDALETFAAAGGSPAAVTAHLEDAGAQVGRLQVGCCAPSRMPLYARILQDLTTVQLSLGSMH